MVGYDGKVGKYRKIKETLFKLRISVSKRITTTWTIFIACIDHRVSSYVYVVIRVVTTIRPALVLNETQIQSIFNTVQEYFYYPLLISGQLDIVR